MVNLTISMMDAESGGWGGGGGGYYPQSEGEAQARLENGSDSSGNFLEDDQMEVELVDPALEMERLCKRALNCLENGNEAALETEMLRQHFETCKLQGTALRPVLLQNVARVLSAAQF